MQAHILWQSQNMLIRWLHRVYWLHFGWIFTGKFTHSKRICWSHCFMKCFMRFIFGLIQYLSLNCLHVFLFSIRNNEWKPFDGTFDPSYTWAAPCYLVSALLTHLLGSMCRAMCRNNSTRQMCVTKTCFTLHYTTAATTTGSGKMRGLCHVSMEISLSIEFKTK